MIMSMTNTTDIDHTAEKNASYTIARRHAAGTRRFTAQRDITFGVRRDTDDGSWEYDHYVIPAGTSVRMLNTSNAGFRGQECTVEIPTMLVKGYPNPTNSGTIRAHGLTCGVFA